MIVEAMIRDTSNVSEKKKKKSKKKKSKKLNKNVDDFKSINKGKVDVDSTTHKKVSSKKKSKKNIKNINNEKIPAREKINAKQLANKKKNMRIKVASISLLVIITLFLLLSSSLFDIRNINVVGIKKLTKEEVISITGITVNTNIFALNKLKAKNKLLDNSYVEDVYIKREYPNTITVDVKEKTPTFMIQFANSFIYLNNQGYMLEVSTEPVKLPVLLGIKTDLSNVKPGRRLDVEDLKKFNKLIQIMDITKNFELSEYITRIDITDMNNYIVYMDSLGKTIYLGNAEDLNTKVLPLKEILKQTEGKSGEIFLNMDLNKQNPRFRESY